MAAWGFGLDWVAWGLGLMCFDRLGFGLFGMSVHIFVLSMYGLFWMACGLAWLGFRPFVLWCWDCWLSVFMMGRSGFGMKNLRV